MHGIDEKGDAMKFVAYETVFPPDGRLCGCADCLPLEDGSVLAVWEKERGTSWTIMGAIRDPKGKWSDPRVIVPNDKTLRRYPVLFRGLGGIIVLMCRAGAVSSDTLHTEQYLSYDNGVTFEHPTRVDTEGDKIGGPSRGNILRLEDGTLLCGGMTPGGECGAYVYRSENGGDDWTRSEVIALPERYKTYRPEGVGLWSPSLWSEGGEYVHALMRSSAGYVFRADSVDGGRTWTQPYPLNVANSNSPICGLSLPDLRVLLLCNPSPIPEGKERGKRSPLVLYESTTGGCTFKRITVLATGYGEFTYPSMKHENGKLYITFTKNKTEIELVIIEL